MAAGEDKPGDKKALWQRAVESGRHAIESTSRLLKRLDVPDFKLEDDSKASLKPGTDSGLKAPPRSSRGPAGPPSRTAGHDPYGRKTGTPNPHVAAKPPRSKSLKKPATVPPPRKSWWKRLFQRR